MGSTQPPCALGLGAQGRIFWGDMWVWWLNPFRCEIWELGMHILLKGGFIWKKPFGGCPRLPSQPRDTVTGTPVCGPG